MDSRDHLLDYGASFGEYQDEIKLIGTHEGSCEGARLVFVTTRRDKDKSLSYAKPMTQSTETTSKISPWQYCIHALLIKNIS